MSARDIALRIVGTIVGVLIAAQAGAQPDEFPFDGELILDVRPMPGSKRIPNMDIDASGGIAVEMWCNRVEGRMVVAGDTVTVLTGEPTQRPCSTERAQGDVEFLQALQAVTHWKRDGYFVRLVGPRVLVFRVPTN